jgi:hypothetical protein
MISRAFKRYGNDPEDVISYIFADMYADEAKELCAFIRWVCKT